MYKWKFLIRYGNWNLREFQNLSQGHQRPTAGVKLQRSVFQFLVQLRLRRLPSMYTLLRYTDPRIQRAYSWEPGACLLQMLPIAMETSWAESADTEASLETAGKSQNCPWIVPRITSLVLVPGTFLVLNVLLSKGIRRRRCPTALHHLDLFL